MPSDLIKKSQIGFRNDAGLSSYKPILKSFPLSALHTSPHCIRCNHCDGELLRGLHSLICVYCGQFQANDLPPQPIVFNSTTAYCWLLESLELNALERIGCFFEEDRRNKGGTPVDEGITLGERLDVRITWRDEVESSESGLVNETFDLISFLNLARVENFDTDFGGGSGSDASEEQSVSRKNDAFIDQDNIGAFQNDVPLEDDVMSYGGDEEGQFMNSSIHNIGSFSEDEAELPSVSSKTQDEDFETNDMSSDLRDKSPSAHDAEVQSPEDSKTNLGRDSLSGDSRMQNEDFATATVSPDLRRDSSSEDDVKVQKLNSDTENEDFKTNLSRDSLSEDEGLKTAVVSSDLRGDSSSEEDAKLQILNSSTRNDDFKTDLSRDSLSGDEDFKSRMQNEDLETAVVSSDLRGESSSEDDVKDQIINSGTQKEDSKTDLRRDSLSGDEDFKSSMQNEDFKTAVVSSDLKGDSSSEDDANIQILHLSAQNEDFKTNVDLSRDSSSGDDAKIQSLKFKTRDDDSKIVDESSDLRGYSSSEDDAKVQISKLSIQNEDFKTNADLRRDSSSEDEDLISRMQNVKTAVLSSDLRSDSSSEDDAKVQILNSSTQNEDSKIDLRKYSLTGDENFNSRMENEKTAIVSSDLKGDSLSEDDSEVQILNSSTQNEHSKNIADLRGDSSSEDDLKVQVLKTSTHSEDFKTNADLSGYSSSEDDAPVQVLNLSTQDVVSKTDLNRDSLSGDEDFKPWMQNEDPKTAVVSSDLRGDSSSEDDSKVQILNPSTQNEHSYTHLSRESLSEDENHNSKMQNEKTAVVSSDLRGDSSSEDDAKVQVSNLSTQDVDFKTDLSRDSLFEDEDFKSRMQNEDSKTVVVSSDLRGDSSSEDDAKVQILNYGIKNEDSKTNVDLRGDSSSEDDAEVQILNSSTQNVDSKTNADLSGDSSSGDDAEVQSLKFKSQNDDTITVDVSPHLRSHSSSEDDKVQILNLGTQNQDSKTNADLSRDSSSGDDTEIESLKFKTRDDDSKFVDRASDLRGDSSSEDDEKVQILNLGTQNEVFKPNVDMSRDLSSGDDTEILSSNLNAQTDDSKTVAASSDLRGHSSSGDEAEIQYVRTHDESPEVTVSRDSSSGDDADIPSVNLMLHDQDSKSAAMSSDSSSDGSSTHNAEIPPVSSRVQTEHSKTTTATSSDLKTDSSSEDDTETKNTDSNTADVSYEDSSRHDAEVVISSDLGRDSSTSDEPDRPSLDLRTHNKDNKSSNDAENQSFRRQDDDFKITDAEIQSLSRGSSAGDATETEYVNSRIQNEDSKITSVLSSNFSRDYKTAAADAMPSDLFRDSSSGDDTDIQSVNRTEKVDSKSVDPFVGSESNLSAHIDLAPGHIEDLNNKTHDD